MRKKYFILAAMFFYFYFTSSAAMQYEEDYPIYTGTNKSDESDCSQLPEDAFKESDCWNSYEYDSYAKENKYAGCRGCCLAAVEVLDIKNFSGQILTAYWVIFARYAFLSYINDVGTNNGTCASE